MGMFILACPTKGQIDHLTILKISNVIILNKDEVALNDEFSARSYLVIPDIL